MSIFEKGTLASLVALGLASLSLFQVVATDVEFFQKAWELMWQNNKITVTTETSPACAKSGSLTYSLYSTVVPSSNLMN